eukprot:ANDGO_08289.mRNA.1 Cyclin-U4-1
MMGNPNVLMFSHDPAVLDVQLESTPGSLQWAFSAPPPAMAMASSFSFPPSFPAAASSVALTSVAPASDSVTQQRCSLSGSSLVDPQTWTVPFNFGHMDPAYVSWVPVPASTMGRAPSCAPVSGQSSCGCGGNSGSGGNCQVHLQNIRTGCALNSLVLPEEMHLTGLPSHISCNESPPRPNLRMMASSSVFDCTGSGPGSPVPLSHGRNDPLSFAVIVPVLACILERMVVRNKHSELDCVTLFHSNCQPSISVRQYLDRIVGHSGCSPECLVLALMYLDRISTHNQKLVISGLSVHRLLITAVMTAAKFFDDAYYNNAHYALIGGVSAAEMNAMELEFLYMVDFSLSFTPEEFEQYRHEVLMHAVVPHTDCSCQLEVLPVWNPFPYDGLYSPSSPSFSTQLPSSGSVPNSVSIQSFSTVGLPSPGCVSVNSTSRQSSPFPPPFMDVHMFVMNQNMMTTPHLQSCPNMAAYNAGVVMNTANGIGYAHDYASPFIQEQQLFPPPPPQVLYPSVVPFVAVSGEDWMHARYSQVAYRA